MSGTSNQRGDLNMRFKTLGGVLTFLLLAALPLRAQITIDFESDTTGAKPNGFTSVDSSQVHFSDSIGADMDVQDSTPETIGQGLAVRPDDPSRLLMTFDVPMQSLSLVFGNDDPCCSNPGDVGLLRVFNGTSVVAQTTVVMNRDDIANQTISITTAAARCFDNAEFYYADSTGDPIDLIEIVDNIELTPCGSVPAASSSALVALALSLLLGGALLLHRRKRRA